MRKSLVVLALVIAGPIALIQGLDATPGVEKALAVLWVIAVLWLSEIIHISFTALLVPILASATGLLTIPEAMANFAHPVIYLFLGGLALAIAMHVQGLDRWLADLILQFTGGRLDRAIFMLAGVSVLLSMWIVNTAVTALMLPLVLGLLSEKDGLPARTRIYALLVIAYSANIGGMGTLIGTAPNALVAGELGLSFVDWLKFGIPLVVLMWPVMMVTLYGLLRPDFLDTKVALRGAEFTWTRERKILIAIFILTVLGWLLGTPLANLMNIDAGIDTWVALAAVIAIGVTRVADWAQIQKSADWGVLLLFGGGLTLSEILKVTGASSFLGLGLAGLMDGWGALLVIATLVVFVVFLTEITSNTATTALLVPVFVSLPAGIIDPAAAALAIGISSSCAFMLPVATPPNALVYGTGQVPQRAMVRNGFYLNLVSAVALTLFFFVKQQYF